MPATAAVVWPVIAIGIWTDLDIPAIWRQVVGTMRSLLLVIGGTTADVPAVGTIGPAVVVTRM